jgi:hypothetical protein
MDKCRFWLFIEILSKLVLSAGHWNIDDRLKGKKRTWGGIERRTRENAFCHFEEQFSEPGDAFHFGPL